MCRIELADIGEVLLMNWREGKKEERNQTKDSPLPHEFTISFPFLEPLLSRSLLSLGNYKKSMKLNVLFGVLLLISSSLAGCLGGENESEQGNNGQEDDSAESQGCNPA